MIAAACIKGGKLVKTIGNIVNTHVKYVTAWYHKTPSTTVRYVLVFFLVTPFLCGVENLRIHTQVRSETLENYEMKINEENAKPMAVDRERHAETYK